MHHDDLPRRTAVSSAAAAMILLAAGSAWPQAAVPTALPQTAAAAPQCVVPTDQARIEQGLPRTALRLSGGLPIKIVAIGSSSTAGAGASSPAESYPSRLEVELNRHFPGHPFTVLNRGVNGEEAVDMVARFQAAVVDEAPHLILWQLGTNSLLRDRPIDPRATVVHEGLSVLKATRADVVLMDPQFAPRVIAKRDVDAVVSQIASLAKEEKVGLFHRFDMMRRWHETEHLPFETFVSPDGLHHNDWSYGCLAKWLGFAIAEAVTRPTETAGIPQPKR
jgi:hypothetical protein